MKYGECKCCKSQEFEFLRAYPGFEKTDIVKCKSCTLWQAQPLPTDEFLANFYQKSFGNDPLCGHDMSSSSERGFRLRATLQFDFIQKICNLNGTHRGKRILDVGCHAASFLSLFKDRGWQVTGVDPNPRSAYGKKWYDIEVIQKLFESGLFEAESFDAILHSHALEHVRDPKDYLDEFYRLLKPGGWVFLEVPNESLENIQNNRLRPHLYFFTPKTLKTLSRNAGFEIQSMRVLGTGPRPKNLLSAKGRQWFRRRLSASYDALGKLNLFTQFPGFGKIFKEDRYFKSLTPHAAMLRALLYKPGGVSQSPS